MEKKQIKITLKTIMIIVFFVTAVIIGGVFIYNSYPRFEVRTLDGKEYYMIVNDKKWRGKYNKQRFYLDEEMKENISYCQIFSYKECVDTIAALNDKLNNKLEMVYTDEKSNYILLVNISSIIDSDIELIDCRKEQNKLQIYAREMLGLEKIRQGYMVVIPTKLPSGSEVEYINCYTSKELDTMKMMCNMNEGSDVYTMSFKPIIYLYPTEDINIKVNLGFEDKLTCVYPQYDSEWNVLAQKGGNLIDLNTNRNLYALYYECENMYDFKMKADGFVVAKQDVAKFLEDKLEVLGLTEYEAEEFIVYWLPILQENEYNYIRFATMDEINQNMPLDFSVKPDTLIRILMTYKGLDKKINVVEQKLEKVERNGFVAVEWGGTEIY